MLRLHQLELSLDDAATFDPSCLRRLCAQRLHLSEKAVAEARLVKRSVDARSRGGVHFSLTADVTLAQGGEAEEKRLASRFKPNQVTVISGPAAGETPDVFGLKLPPWPADKGRPLVVGAGPAGLFCALALAARGARPILVERGKPVEARSRDVEQLETRGEMDPESNVLFGEGGAGAYDCGDFGFLPIANLSLAQTSQSIGVAQADDGDLPVVVLGDPDDEKSVIGALCSGAQARITSYTQTDYVQISLGSLVGYVKKSQIRVLTAPNEPLSDRIPQRATTKTDVDIRFKPEVKAAVAETVSSGARVYMFGKFGDWAYVLAGDSPSLDVTATTGDRAGFVPLAALNAPASTTHLTASVLKDKVNVRSEADNQSGAIIGKARTGDRLLVTDYGNKWTGVVLPNGKRGYMMTEYLQFD